MKEQVNYDGDMTVGDVSIHKMASKAGNAEVTLGVCGDGGGGGSKDFPGKTTRASHN